LGSRDRKKKNRGRKKNQRKGSDQDKGGQKKEKIGAMKRGKTKRVPKTGAKSQGGTRKCASHSNSGEGQRDRKKEWVPLGRGGRTQADCGKKGSKKTMNHEAVTVPRKCHTRGGGKQE